MVEDRANALLADGLQGVKRISLDVASGHVKAVDLVQRLSKRLADIVDMAAIRSRSDAER
ncbi:hypothetical protein KCP73_03930 [Salmonella enterica subsp. enterica]|nr:hypothetical protein KCP73_03930 [Salmonella enterica subsp. enterica]